MWTKDPNYNSVALHVPFTGEHGSTTFTDYSDNAVVPVLTGDVSISNAQSKFGGTSGRFNGGRLTFSNPSAYAQSLLRSQRGFQLWIRPDSVATAQTILWLPSSDNASNDVKLRIRAGGALQWNVASADFFDVSAGVVVAGQWNHILCSYGQYGNATTNVGGRAHVNGVQQVNYAGGDSRYCGGGTFTVGSQPNGAEPFIGYIQDLQYAHRNIFNASTDAGQNSFSPPDGLLPTTLGVDSWGELQTDPLFAVAPMPQSSISRVASPMRREANWYFGGDGRIVGTVKEKGIPYNLPLVRKVRLFREFDGLFVDETWSDAAGNYTFDYIDRSVRYTVVSYDYSQTYRAVIADNLLPELMP